MRCINKHLYSAKSVISFGTDSSIQITVSMVGRILVGLGTSDQPVLNHQK